MISVRPGTTVKAVAFKSGMADSSVAQQLPPVKTVYLNETQKYVKSTDAAWTLER